MYAVEIHKRKLASKRRGGGIHYPCIVHDLESTTEDITKFTFLLSYIDEFQATPNKTCNVDFF
ncbi:hypothetical protein JOC48_000838 [Aquibacillus albus]|uniref:Uncharacterized protein n=1 Tax=Aquibacillus albus TaxID=1168171 RepID=A0ABS2MXE3_9BACI|nr:hypothetical protein [Aquibacillus albus]